MKILFFILLLVTNHSIAFFGFGESDKSKYNSDTKKYNQGVKLFESGNYEKAFKIFKPLADNGYASAQTSLGWLYDNGLGRKEDNVEAVKWYQKAANQDDHYALYILGLMYAHGEGVRRDQIKSFELTQRSAKQAYAPAQYNLGVAYKFGQGVTKSLSKSKYWIKKAKDSDDHVINQKADKFWNEFKLWKH